MPREPTITYEQVEAAANAIKAEGQRPTWRAVRERLGTGSGGTIHRMLQRWEANQTPQIEAPLSLPPALQRSMLEFIGQEVAAAKAALGTELGESKQAAADLATENERQSAQIEAMQGQVEQMQAEKAGLEGRLVQMEADLMAARNEATREREAAEAARTELAKAQLRLEGIPRLENDLKEARGAYEKADLRRQEAERNLAVCQSERQATEARANELVKKVDDGEKQLQATKAKIADLEGDLKVISTKASAFEAQLRDLEADKEHMERELVEARKEGKETAAYVGRLEGVVEALQGEKSVSGKGPKK